GARPGPPGISREAAAPGHSRPRPARLHQDETRTSLDASRRVHLRLRRGGRNPARQGAVRRRGIHLTTTRFRTVFTRSGTRGFPQPLRAEKDAGADSIHFEKRKALEELTHWWFAIGDL